MSDSATLWTADDLPKDPPGFCVGGIFQGRKLEFPIIGDFPDPGIEPWVQFLTSPELAGGFFTTSTTWETQVNNKNKQKNYICSSLRYGRRESGHL